MSMGEILTILAQSKGGDSTLFLHHSISPTRQDVIDNKQSK